MILIKDGIKYSPYTYKSEDELEKMIIEHHEEIFGEDSLFFGKQKIKSLSGIGAIPDGFIISIEEMNWYILEVERSNHDLYKHIVPQITKFSTAYSNPSQRNKLAKAFHKESESDLKKQSIFKSKKIREVYKLLSEIIESEPSVVVIIDQETEQLKEVSGVLPFKTITREFKTFVRTDVGLGVHIHLFEPVVVKPTKIKKVKKGEITPQSKYRSYILETLMEMGGKGKSKDIVEKVGVKMKNILTKLDYEILPSGTDIRWENHVGWERFNMVKKGLLRNDSPSGIWELSEEVKKKIADRKKKKVMKDKKHLDISDFW